MNNPKKNKGIHILLSFMLAFTLAVPNQIVRASEVPEQAQTVEVADTPAEPAQATEPTPAETEVQNTSEEQEQLVDTKEQTLKQLPREPQEAPAQTATTETAPEEQAKTVQPLAEQLAETETGDEEVAEEQTAAALGEPEQTQAVLPECNTSEPAAAEAAEESETAELGEEETETLEQAAQIQEQSEEAESATGPEAQNTDSHKPEACETIVDSEQEKGLTVINVNEASIETETHAEGDTGNNELTSEEDDIEDSGIQTGDVNVYANVLTIVNTNLTASDIVAITENYNNLSTDLVMNQPELTAGERTQNLASGVCEEGVACQSLSTFTLTNKNSADVSSNASANGNSGNNSITAEDELERSHIRTGDVNAVVNVLTIVNTNLVNSRWIISTFNVFGDWEGDLVFPSELYFKDAMSVGDTLDQSVEDVEKVIIENQNTATVKTNASAQATTGANGIESDDNIDDSAIVSGDATAAANTATVANTNLINTQWFLGIVNVLGEWTGSIYSVPEQVGVTEQPYGLTFFATNNPNANLEDLNEAASCECEEESGAEISNENDAVVVVNAEATANTGGNALASEGGDVEESTIATGAAKALANVLTFANTNLINSDLYVGLLNVFGAWHGNIVFGYPDLQVSQRVESPSIAASKGTTVPLTIAYANNSSSTMQGATLEWHFDPTVFGLKAAPSGSAELAPGVIAVALGNLSPGANGSINPILELLGHVSDNTALLSFAKIYGSGPEKNLTNNESQLTLTAHSALNPHSGSRDSDAESTQNNNQGSTDTQPNNQPQQQNGQQNQQNQNNPSNSAQNPAANSPLLVSKSNNRTGVNLSSGSSVTFTITITNASQNVVHNVVVYDTMRNSGGGIVASQQYDLGTMKAGEVVDITYVLPISDQMPNGVYTNSAYAKGLTQSLQLVISPTALSTITIGVSQLTELPEDEEEEQIPEELVEGEEDTEEAEENNGQVLATTDSNTPGSFKLTSVEATRTQSALNPSSSLGLLEGAAAPVQAQEYDFSLLPPTHELATTKDTSNQLASTLLICLLVAVGWALSSARQRSAGAKPRFAHRFTIF